MRRRTRAVAFACMALACAGLAAAIAGGYRTDVEGQLGPLRSAVVARGPLHAGRAIDPAAASRLLTVRRVPARFLPPGTLADPAQAVGLEPVARIPAGAYVLGAQLRPARTRGSGGRPSARLDPGRQAVEIAVSGAGALAAAGGSPIGTRVDVVVTSEPGPGGRGRTYVAAQRVELLALSERGGGDGFSAVGAEWTATLAVTREQALRLIEAENFAREVRLIPR